MDYSTLLDAFVAASESHQVRLDLSDCSIAELPTNIGALADLEWLDLSNNNLRHLPPEIGDLHKLKHLDLTNNELVTLPPEFESLVPRCQVYLNSNPFNEIPHGVQAQGTEGVLTYLTRRWSQSERQWVSKVLIVGEGGVGKTCLINAMKSRKFDPQSETTHGISIDKLDILHPNQKDNPYIVMGLNCWDFGGQEIYHATHQFFYTDRSLFVLVWNARLGYEQSKVYSWLERIQLLAPDSPIILVATHIDERRSPIPTEDLQNRYPQIKGSYAVSNKTGEGVPKLVNTIAEVAAHLPLMGEKWPSSWLSSAEEIRALMGNYISNNKLNRIFKNNGVDTESRPVLSRWLHDLGDILYYPDDSELKHRVFLNPQWVTETISYVLEYEDISDGVFTKEHMNRVWSNLDTDLRYDFLKLMQKFDLSYNIVDAKEEDDAQCLVVELLPLDSPEYKNIWESESLVKSYELSITYHLNASIPPGIPTWFIARSHRFTTNTHWRFGAMLQDSSERNNLALIKTPPNSRKVDLSVRGVSPYNLFVILREGLELTLSRYPGLEVRKAIPCKTVDESGKCPHEFEEEDVLRRLHKGRPTIECPKCDKDIEIPELVFGINLFDQFRVVDAIEKRVVDAIEKKLVEPNTNIIEENSGLRELLQREFARQQNTDQSFIESHCPSVFSLRPTETKSWTEKKLYNQKWELELYCEMPGEWHPVGECGRYVIEQPAEWMTTLSPHVSRLVKAMKLVTPIVGPWLNYTEHEIASLVKNDIALIEKLVNLLPNVESETNPFTVSSKRGTQKAGGASLRRLRILLEYLDAHREWGNLNKILTPEGHYFWLCEHHSSEILAPK